MISNHPNLDDILHKPFSEVADLPVDQLQMLLDEIKTLKSKADNAASFLQTVLAHKYDFDSAYTDKGEATGIVNIPDGEFVVSMNRPKRVDWNQRSLAEIETILREEWNEQPDEYIETTRKVAEKKWSAWPSSIRDLFTKARSVKAGKPSIKIEGVK